MYSQYLMPSPRSRSPVFLPRHRRQRAYLLGGCAILFLWHTILSSRGRSHAYPQFEQEYHTLQTVRNRPMPHYRGSDTHSLWTHDPNLLGQSEEHFLEIQGKASHKDHKQTGYFNSKYDIQQDSDQEPWNPDGKLYQFPTHDQLLELEAGADSLPDVMHIPLEEAVQRETLEGWEDEWFSSANYDNATWGALEEPLVDFIYTWVNGSQAAFQRTMRPYELRSTLNDLAGRWLDNHGANRYRSWDELRYSVRSIEKYASNFTNKIQILVNAVDESRNPDVRKYTKQRPMWLREEAETAGLVETLSQEEFFGEDTLAALPSFNSLTIESQQYNTPSDIDRFFAMSDDMLLGKPHAVTDIYSPIFGPTMAFKLQGFNTETPPTEEDAQRFGEKPFLIYTSWMLNRRFGVRSRRGQAHFGHSMSRSIAKEVRDSFPRPSLRAAVQRFRGEAGFQLYTWYAAFHYTVERHREALLYSYIMHRSDTDGDSNLSWAERMLMMQELEDGMSHEGSDMYRDRISSEVADLHRAAGLPPPQVNVDTQWTSLEGPMTIMDIDCLEFDVNECLAPGFSTHTSDKYHSSPAFSTAVIFDRVARQDPECGDCLLKLILNRQRRGLEPLLPPKDTMPAQRQVIIKALKRYHYSVIQPDAKFFMINDARQVRDTLAAQLLGEDDGEDRIERQVGQLCLNDDVATNDGKELADLESALRDLFEGLLPEPSRFENDR